MNWRDRDRIQAKYRMRRLRATKGGMTEFDLARNYAVKKLTQAHKLEFTGYRREFLRAYLKQRSA